MSDMSGVIKLKEQKQKCKMWKGEGGRTEKKSDWNKNQRVSINSKPHISLRQKAWIHNTCMCPSQFECTTFDCYWITFIEFEQEKWGGDRKNLTTNETKIRQTVRIQNRTYPWDWEHKVITTYVRVSMSVWAHHIWSSFAYLHWAWATSTVSADPCRSYFQIKAYTCGDSACHLTVHIFQQLLLYFQHTTLQHPASCNSD